MRRRPTLSDGGPGNPVHGAAGLIALVLFLLLAACSCARSDAMPRAPSGRFYHGVYPGGITGYEDDITPNDLNSYEQTVGKTAVWCYFSHQWFHGRVFPMAATRWIHGAGSVPYVRLMMRSDSAEESLGDPVYFTFTF